MTKKEVRQQFKEMVVYLLTATPTDNNEVIEGYTDTLVFGAEEYCKLFFLRRKNQIFEQEEQRLINLPHFEVEKELGEGFSIEQYLIGFKKGLAEFPAKKI